MSINEKILEKLNNKTKDNPEIKEFLIKLLRKESDGLGWYKDTYKELLEEIVKEEN